MRVNVGVFGRGPWADLIVGSLKALPDEDVEIVWRRGRDWRDGPEEPVPLHGVIIATAAATHTEVAVPFLKAGVPCFIEKPVAMNPTEGRQLLSAWETGKYPGVVIDHIPLYSTAYRALRATVSRTRLLSAEVVMTGNGPFRPDVSALWDYGPHAMAAAVDLLGRGPYHVEHHMEHVRAGTMHKVTLSQAKVRDPVVRIVFGNGDRDKRRTVEVRTPDGPHVADVLNGTFDGNLVGDADRPLTLALNRFVRMIGSRDVDHPAANDLELGVHVTELIHSIEGTGAWAA